jgi:hypothetical protein
LSTNRQSLRKPAWVICCPLEATTRSADHAIGIVATVEVVKADITTLWARPPESLSRAIAIVTPTTVAYRTVGDYCLARRRDVAEHLIEIGLKPFDLLHDAVEVVAD